MLDVKNVNTLLIFHLIILSRLFVEFSDYLLFKGFITKKRLIIKGFIKLITVTTHYPKFPRTRQRVLFLQSFNRYLEQVYRNLLLNCLV